MNTAPYLLDVRQLLCPLPVIRLQNIIKTLTSGTIIHILCTDPGTHHDIPTWCRMYGHKVLLIEEKQGEIHFLVEIT